MRVKCFICEKISEIDPYSFIAKRIRNRPLTTYMCPECDHRIRLHGAHKERAE